MGEIGSEEQAKLIRVDTVKNTLKQHGIDEAPDGYNKEHQKPYGWIFRGTQDKNSLFNGEMEPKSGEFGYTGVFFADKPEKASIYTEGMLIVVPSDVTKKDWIPNPSPQFNDLFYKAAKEHNYDVTTVSGGLAAEQRVFEKHPVYQYKRYIATLPETISMEAAKLILVTPNFLDKTDLDKIAPAIRGKIVTINYK